MKQVIDIPGRTVPGGLVIGGMTRLLDVWSPSPLVMCAPAFVYRDHQLVFTFGERESQPVQHGKKSKLKHKLGLGSNQIHRLKDSEIYFDCRHDATANVAHVLQNQIGVALTGLAALGISDRWRDLVFVVPAETPVYAQRLFEVMGFRVLRISNEPVSGWRLQMEPMKFPYRAHASRVLRAHALQIGLLSDSDPEGELIFLSRRSRRTLTNMDEIEPVVNQAGFRTVYAEDLSVEDQIQTIARAKGIFGLHGAAMGFMMFSDPNRHSLVIECFPSVFATGWARANAFEIGATWIGCQGEFDFNAIAEMHAGAHAHTFEALNYRLGTHAVESLLRMSTKVLSAPNRVPLAELILDVDHVDIHIPTVQGVKSIR